jgi:hypothetical protein
MGDATDRVIRYHQTLAPYRNSPCRDIRQAIQPLSQNRADSLAFGLLSLQRCLRMVGCGKSAATNVRDVKTRARTV